METWRKVWREGIQPHINNAGLIALMDGLRLDDETLVQGATTVPAPLQCLEEWPCEGACLLGYIAWKAYGADTVGKVVDYFTKLCYEASEKVGDPEGCRYFLNWYDDCPRDEMQRAILSEISRELAIRHCAEPVVTIDQISERNHV